MHTEALRVDFSMNRGHEMVIDREGGMKRDELDEIEINMLQSRKIPKMLDIEWVDIDGRVTFRYALRGKRLLTHKLQTQMITMADFYTLLLAVAEALDDSRHYMLRTEGYLLHEHNIFVGERWDDIALAYVPLRDRAACSPCEAVQMMAVRWYGYVLDPDGNGLQQVLVHLRDDQVSWNLLRQSLLTLLNGTTAGSSKAQGGAADSGNSWPRDDRLARSGTAIPGSSASMPGRGTVNQPDSPDSDAEYPGLNDSWFQDAESGLHDSDAIIEPNNGEQASSGSVRPETGRPRIMLWAGLVVAMAVIWRFIYLASPGRASLLLSLGLTFLAVGAAVFFSISTVMKKGRAGQPSDNHTEWNDDDGFVPDSAILDRWKSLRHEDGSSDPRSGGAGRTDTASGQGAEWGEPAEENMLHRSSTGGRPINRWVGEAQPRGRFPAFPSADVNSHIQVPEPSLPPASLQQEMTVLLGSGTSEERPGKSGKPWLERDMGGRVERVPLEERRFVIGRSDNGVHYIDDFSGISRAHIELVLEKDVWRAKDIGSRNGSSINGTEMIPYKSYPLSDGDVFQLAGEKGPKYAFRTV